MFTGGDGYTAFAGGTDVLQPGDGLLEVAIEWVTRPLAGRADCGGSDRAGLRPICEVFRLVTGKI